MLKERLAKVIEEAVAKTACEKEAHDGAALPEFSVPEFSIEVPKDRQFGDYATNVAFVLAKARKSSPKALAESIASAVAQDDIIEKVSVAGSGFINFYLSPSAYFEVLEDILTLQEEFGKQDVGRGQPVQIEFVSANPTGPLHVGNGRGGAIGDVLANLFKFFNFSVTREYYVNDAETSLQMENLSQTLDARYRQSLGEEAEIPEEGYHGHYLKEMGEKIAHRHGRQLLKLSTDERMNFLKQYAMQEMLLSHKKDVRAFGVNFDVFFSEESLYRNKETEALFEMLKEKNLVYEQDGALWFTSQKFGDEKDRVLVRSDGKPTYFAADIAYHKNKFDRGFKRVLNVWGADHHGHVQRMKAALSAMGYDASRLEIILYQLVHLYDGGELVRMSKRSGDLVTLGEVMQDVGRDAARYFFLMRDANTTLDFDLDLAKQQNEKNPVYYVQYAYCRIQSIFEQAKEKEIHTSPYEPADLSVLTHENELALIKALSTYPDIVHSAFASREVHRLPLYAHEVAVSFHAFYHTCRVLKEDEKKDVVVARLKLIEATRIILEGLFALLGISAPEKM